MFEASGIEPSSSIEHITAKYLFRNSGCLVWRNSISDQLFRWSPSSSSAYARRFSIVGKLGSLPDFTPLRTGSDQSSLL